MLSQIVSECEELIGRLSAIRVNFPDTEVRVKHTIFNLKKVLEKPPTAQQVAVMIDDLQDLRAYLVDILKMDPEYLRSHFVPCVEVIDLLLGPTQTQH